MNYSAFLGKKSHLAGDFGFDPTWMPQAAYPFQEALIEWATRKGRAAIFADCGLGKTLMQLAWAENVAKRTGGRVLILTPLAVGHQTVAEAEKFGVEAARSRRGELQAQIVVTNYERLKYFDSKDFRGVVCDESSILKNFDGATKAAVTEFCRLIEYRLLCTATAAPNDFIELGTSSEALGHMGHISMLKRFFKSTNNYYAVGGGRSRFAAELSGSSGFYLKPHATNDFWRWVCSWARAARRPSDLGFCNEGFCLPELTTEQHVVKARMPNPEYLFDMPAVGLAEQRAERARTVGERCDMAAEIAEATSRPVVCWCHLNKEGDMLEKLIPDSVQVSGADSDEKKEESFRAFESGQVRVMVTKPSIAGFGLNWQHCSDQVFFPSHSFEQWYQAVRRSWRFGQKRPVKVSVITSEGESRVLRNLERKAAAAEQMFELLVEYMADELCIAEQDQHLKKEILPTWIT